MRVIRLLALRRLRLQPLRSILAALVVAGGASLLVTILVITASLRESVNEAGRALAGPAPLRVLGPVLRGGIDQDAIATIRATEGVEAAIPMIQSIAMVDPGDGGDDIAVTVLGADCSVQALLGRFADAPCDDAALAGLETPLIGARLADEIAAGGTVRTNIARVPLDGAIAVPGLDAINKGRVVAFPLEEAERQLTRSGRVDLVYILPTDGAEVATVQAAVTAALPRSYEVLRSTDPPPVVGVVLSTFLPLFTIIALLTLAIGSVLVRNSIVLSLEERRRQTAIVGALGGSRGLLVGGTILEVAVLGAVGGLLGVAAGVGLAYPVSRSLDSVTREIAGIPLEIHVPPSAVVAGVAIGLVVAIGSAIRPARRAVRIDVAAELASRGAREETVASSSPLRLLLGLAVTAGGVAMCFVSQRDGGVEPWQATVGPVGFLVTSIGSVMSVAVLAPMVLQGLDQRLSFRRGATRLAWTNLRREPKRTAVMAVALGFAVGVGFVTASFNKAVAQEITEALNRNLNGLEVSSTDSTDDSGTETRLTPDVIAGLEQIDGVARIERGSFVVIGNKARSLVGAVAFTDPWLDNGTALGSMSKAELDAGEVVIGPALARNEGLRPGDVLDLATPTGTAHLPVMAVAYNGNFGGRNVQMSYALLEELYGPQAPFNVVVVPDEGVSEAELARRIEAADLDPGLDIRLRQEVIDNNTAEIAEQLSTFDAVQRGLLVMSFIAVLSTLVLVGVQRRKEMGMLAAVGMTPEELRRMVLSEAGIVAVLGVVITGALAVVQLLALVLITPVVIGYKDPFVMDLPAMLRYGVIAVLVALVAALYPARRAARVEVLDALRYE